MSALFNRLTARWNPTTPEQIASGEQLPLGFKRGEVNLAVERLMRFAGRDFLEIDSNEITFVGFRKGKDYTPSTLIAVKNLDKYSEYLNQDQALLSRLQAAGAQTIALPKNMLETYSLGTTRSGLNFTTNWDEDYAAVAAIATKDKINITSPVHACIEGNKLSLNGMLSLYPKAIEQFDHAKRALDITLARPTAHWRAEPAG